MKIITVDVTFKSGMLHWNLWQGMKMARVDDDRWVRYRSLLEVRLRPKYRNLINDQGVVEDAFLFKDVSVDELVLLPQRRPESVQGRVYICLELDVEELSIGRIGSVGCRFGYPIMFSESRSRRGRRSYVWQIDNDGALTLMIGGGLWRIENKRQRVSLTEPQESNRILAEDVPYQALSAKTLEISPNLTPLHHRNPRGLRDVKRLLDMRELAVEGLLWTDGQLSELGHHQPSRYSRLNRLPEMAERSFRQRTWSK